MRSRRLGLLVAILGIVAIACGSTEETSSLEDDGVVVERQGSLLIAHLGSDQVTEVASADLSPIFGGVVDRPDGTSVYYVTKSGDRYEMHGFDVQSGGSRPIDVDVPDIVGPGAVSVSPDGAKIAFALSGEVQVVDISSGSMEVAADASDFPDFEITSFDRVTWLPSGDALGLQASRVGGGLRAVASRTGVDWAVGQLPFGWDWSGDLTACWAQAGASYPTNLVAAYRDPAPAEPTVTAAVPGTDCVWLSETEFAFTIPVAGAEVETDVVPTVTVASMKEGGAESQFSVPSVAVLDTATGKVRLLATLIGKEDTVGAIERGEAALWDALHLVALGDRDQVITWGENLTPYRVGESSAEEVLKEGDNVLAVLEE